MFRRAALLFLPLSAAAQPCAPAADRTIVLQLPGRPGLPAGSQMKIEMPITLVPETCPPPPAPPFDALHGPKPADGSVLSGEPARPKPKPVD